MNAPQQKKVEDMTGAELVAAHNNLVTDLGDRVTRFASRADGIKRVNALLTKRNSPEVAEAKAEKPKVAEVKSKAKAEKAAAEDGKQTGAKRGPKAAQTVTANAAAAKSRLNKNSLRKQVMDQLPPGESMNIDDLETKCGFPVRPILAKLAALNWVTLA